MKTGKMKLALSAGALALSMALAGCGGSSSSGSATTPAATTTSSGSETAAEMRTRLIGEATTAVAAFGTAVEAIAETAVGDPASADDEREAAGEAIRAARAAGASNADLEEAEDDFTRHVQALGVKQQKIAAAIAAQMDIDTANAKDRTDKAKALRTALANGNIAVRGATRTDSENGTVFVSNGDNPRIIIQVDGDDATDDVTVYLTEKATVSPLGDWKGTHHEGKQGTGDAARTGMVRTYSNRDDPEMEDFGSAAAEPARVGLGTQVTETGPLLGTFPITTSGEHVYSRHIASDSFAKSGTETHVGDTATVDGTYKDVDGKFICTVGACTSQYDEDTGNIILAGTWNFAPAPGAKLPVEKDNDYLHFGWWKLENSKDEATAIRVFATAMGVASDATSYTHVNVITDRVQVWHGADMVLVSS